MRFLFVCDSVRQPVTGAGRMSLTLLRELVSQGHEVVGLDFQPNPLVESITGRCVVLPTRLPWARTALWHFTLLRRIPGLHLAHDWVLDPTAYPDVLGHHPHLALFVLDLSPLRPRTYKAFKRTWFRLFYGRSLTKAKTLICISEHTKTELLSTYPHLPPDRCTVLHCSLDPALAQGSQPQATGSESERPPYFLSVGTIEARKNTAGLVEAYARARSQGLASDLILAGRPGHRAQETLSRIQQPDLKNHVHLKTGCDDQQIQRLYHQARGLLFPSLDEGFGLPILEAMAANIPVLTSDCSSMPEVAGDAALLVDPQDPDAIAAGILRLDQDQDLRQQLITRGRQRLQHFNPTIQAQRLVKLLTANLQP